jgi:serine/threonine protein kinase
MTANAVIPSELRAVQLAELVEHVNVRLHAAEPVDLDELLRVHPEHAEELKRLLPAIGLLADLSRSASRPIPVGGEGDPLGELGDFRLIREVGRGGMGVVYEAEQISLRRRVALKVLPFAATMDPRQLQRFRHEAQAAAMLHHPHIVPVHGVGCERGVHYYVMQLISGRSLATVIDELRGEAAKKDEGGMMKVELEARTTDFHSSSMPHPSSFPTTPVAALSTKASRPGKAHYRRVAEVIAQAAGALEYAHATGVVHRDIKPANLLLDESGHLWVTDFGLAKLDTAAGVTMSGDVLGTLRYMSPEQALARHGLVDHRTDVYSLGATLYELLTLTPAVGGQDKQEVLRRIAFDGVVAPRRLDRSIPAELETVTLKALAKSPADRYQTAQELADDLRRFLDDRPVLARRPTWPQRLRKWARRHRGVVATGAIAAVVLVATTVTALAVGLVQVNQEKERTRSALDGEAKRRQQARDALDATTSLMLEDLFARQQILTDEHKRFLNRSLQAYEEFAAETAGDEASRHGAARALANAGRIRFRLDPSPEAAETQRQAVVQFERLAADFPSEPRYQRELVLAQRELGKALAAINRRDEAAAALNAAVAGGERLIADHPHVPEHQGEQALTYFYLGQLGTRTPKEAIAAFRKAIGILEPLITRFGEVPDYRETLARTESVLSTQLGNINAPAQDVAGGFRRSIAVFQELAAQSPGNAKYRLGLAQALNNLANRLPRGREQLPEIERAYRDALELFRGLAQEYPAVPQYRLDLATGLANLGSLLRDTRPAEAESSFLDALAAAKRLGEDYPKVLAYRPIRGAAAFNLGLLYLDTGRLAEADKYLGDALVIRRELVEASDGHAFQYSLAHNLVGLADLRSAQKQFRGGVELLQEAVPHHQLALRAQPHNPFYRRSWSDSRRVLADNLLGLSDHEAAAAAVEEYVIAATDVAYDNYRAACRLSRCAALASEDSQLPHETRGRKADDYARRAIERLRAAAGGGFKDIGELETNADLQTLRTREDFQEFLAQVKAGAKD